MQLPADKLSPNAIKNISSWLNEPKYSEYKAELESLIMAGDWQQLEDSFFQVIEFGTAGIRGKTGIGSNRINRVKIGESAQALCEYALTVDEKATEKGIVIAYDTRLTSNEFSKVAAEVVAANGFKTYIFDGFRATPELSFAVRYLKCAAGIVISASHNPPTDNGFKAYWNDGGQLSFPHDKGVISLATKVNEIKSIDYNQAVADGKITIIGKDVDEVYIKTVSAETLGKDRDISIVYSPLHGTGQTSVLPALRHVGFSDISVVESQMVPDGNFPTIPSGKPNPEEKAANDLAVAQLMSESADIAITNDPDADRIGIIVRQGREPIYLNGNQSAILAVDYSLSKLKSLGKLTANHYIVKTVVTTDMLNALAGYYGVKIYDNIQIGFKYIANLILSKENTDEIFVIGCEESFGMLKGDYARDKDAVTGALPLAEYAAELKKDGKTLYYRLLELYEQHGIYVETLNNIICPGASGFDQMQRIMRGLRESTPGNVCGHVVTAILDYATLEKREIDSGKISPIDSLACNMIVLEFNETKKRITIRPSGTEPKIKLYVQWYSDADKQRPVKDQYSELESHLGELAKVLEAKMLEF